MMYKVAIIENDRALCMNNRIINSAFGQTSACQVSQMEYMLLQAIMFIKTITSIMVQTIDNMLRMVEELTLYVTELKKENEEIKKRECRDEGKRQHSGCGNTTIEKPIIMTNIMERYLETLPALFSTHCKPACRQLGEHQSEASDYNCINKRSVETNNRFNMKKYYLILILSICLNVVKAQNETVIPPSPNAYAFTKYVDLPASTYTGVTPISIPLGSLSEKGAKIDISLSYHASGIKVDEIASWIGTGWSLNAGGAITRAAKHKAERPDGNGGIAPARLDIGFPEVNEETGRFDNLNILYSATTRANINDIEPDIFYYNFNGRSGKFVFENDGDVQFYKYEDLKVEFLKSDPNEPVSANNSKFIITDENGVTYEFDEIDSEYSIEYSELIPSSWHLTKIESPQGGLITINYTKRTASHYYNEISSILIDEGDNIDHFVWSAPRPHYANSTEVFLQSISTSNSGRIEFNVNTSVPRKDYTRLSYPLDEISFYNGNADPIKHVKLQTSYFVAQAFTSDFARFGDAVYEHLRYRLKLEAVTIYSADKQKSQPPFTFEYYTDINPTLYNLPYRLSPDQDHWGFFNSAGNITLIPKITWTVYAGYWFNRIMNMGIGGEPYSTSNFTGGANREAHSEAAKACSLHKISYPTGGHTIYNLESHDYIGPEGYSIGGGLRVASIINYNSNNDVANQKNYVYKDFHPNSDPPYNIGAFSSGELINDPRNFYVMLGRGTSSATGANGVFHIPKGHIGGIFGDWSNIDFVGNDNYNGEAYVSKISTIPQAVIGSTHGQAVGYGTVIEFSTGNGYAVSKFTTSLLYPDYWNGEEFIDLDAPVDIFRSQYSNMIQAALGVGPRFVVSDIPSNQFPFLPLYDTDWKRGHLLSVIHYNESRQKISSQVYEYYTPNRTNVAGYKVYNINDVPGNQYIHGKYYIPTNWVAQIKQTNVQYDQNGNNPVTTITDFEYNSPNHKLLTTKKSHDSHNNSIISKNSYPQDYDNVSNFSALINKNIIGKPIDVRTYRDMQLTSGIQTKYNENGQPIDVYNVEIDNGVIDIPFVSSTPYSFTHKTNFTYNVDKNIMQVSPTDGIHTSYLWGYNNSLPVAKIMNTKLNKTVDLIATSKSLSATTNTTVSTETLVGSLTLDTDQTVKINYTYNCSFNNCYVGNDYHNADLLIKDESGQTISNSYVHLWQAGTISKSHSLPQGTYKIYYTATLTRPPACSSYIPLYMSIPIKVHHTYQEKESNIVYESFEEDPSASTAYAKSGNKSKYGAYTITGLSDEPGAYIISYCLYNASAKKWEYYEKEISGQTSYAIPSGGRYLDEIRYYPKGAQMTTYTHDPLIGMTSHTDPNGKTITYEYDDFGRLKNVKDNDGNILNYTKYQYKQ